MRTYSWVSPKCRVAGSPLGGRGLFAVEPIEFGETLCVWGGVVITAAELAERRERDPSYENRCIAIADGFSLGPTPGEVDDAELINHSCDPNAGLVGQIILVARRSIGLGEEVTLDYETAETGLPPFRCQCGAPWCRRIIDGSGADDPEFVRRHAGYLSPHVARRAELALGTEVQR